MNYVVLDLEWNQCPSGRAESVQRLPFEIIEIGAIKLDSKMREVGRFDRLIKPQIYDRIHSVISEITKFTMKELENKGIYFEYAMKEFIEWCGEDYIFCTWGSQDLSELQRNMKFYHLENPFQLPFFYLDIQKLFSLRYEDGKATRALEWAVEYLQIEKTNKFHRAIDDVEYTAKVMREIKFDGKIDKYYSIDLFRKPANRKEEIHMVYDTYSKYVSRCFSTKERAMADREVRQIKCYACEREGFHESVSKIAPWFSDNSRTYYFLGECPNHGFLKGKVRLRKNEDDRIYVIKTMKLVDADGAAEVLAKQLAIREKRRRKRLNITES